MADAAARLPPPPRGPPTSNSRSDDTAVSAEAILLGNLAPIESGKKLEWDGEKMEVKNSPKVSKLIHAEYRDY